MFWVACRIPCYHQPLFLAQALNEIAELRSVCQKEGVTAVNGISMLRLALPVVILQNTKRVLCFVLEVQKIDLPSFILILFKHQVVSVHDYIWSWYDAPKYE